MEKMEEFKKYALENFPMLLKENMDDSDPTNRKKLVETIAILIKNFFDSFEAKISKTKNLIYAKRLMNYLDYYYEIHIKSKFPMFNIEDFNDDVKKIWTTEISPSARSIHRKSGKGSANRKAAKNMFHYLQNKKINSYADYSGMILDRYNFAEFARLPLKERKKRKFEELNKVNEHSMDHLLFDDTTDVFFWQVFN